jgi:uncharacterized membrane protein
MTTEPKYSSAAQAVINDYLDRLKHRLAGFPPADREDLLREIACHIDEAFAAETGGEEMDRLLRVLRRLGEPAEVISERMSPAMINLGKKKGLPFYILSGALIAFVGLPLGLSAGGILIGVLAAIFGLLLAYFAMGISLLVSGVAGMIVSAILLIDPGIFDRINRAFGGDIHFGLSGLGIDLPIQTQAIITLAVCGILTAVGALILWGGRYILRGTGYLFKISWQKIKEAFNRPRRIAAPGQSNWDAKAYNH